MKNQLVYSRNGSRTRRRFSAIQIEEFLDRFERGGLSAAAFVRQEGLCYSAFCRWRRQREGRAPSPLRLQPLPMGSLLGSSWAAEIAWPNGLTLRLQGQVAAAWAKALIEELRGSC